MHRLDLIHRLDQENGLVVRSVRIVCVRVDFLSVQQGQIRIGLLDVFLHLEAFAHHFVDTHFLRRAAHFLRRYLIRGQLCRLIHLANGGLLRIDQLDLLDWVFGGRCWLGLSFVKSSFLWILLLLLSCILLLIAGSGPVDHRVGPGSLRV